MSVIVWAAAFSAVRPAERGMDLDAMDFFEERVQQHRKSHWAYQPIELPAPPVLEDNSWVRRAVDRFVLAELRDVGLTSSPLANRYTLVRRATFDLLGLPPTYEEVQSFVRDNSPAAYQKLVDRLLASVHYGERWGRHWLDVVRYADTQGQIHQRERAFPYSYTYRDYVIRALNDDLPFDQFVVEQLAADRLRPDGDPRALAGLGLLTLGRRYKTPHDDIDDQVDTVTRGLLGLTVSCARCHDHKYDAITTQDYYALYGVFASSQEPDQRPLLTVPKDTPEYKEFEAGYLQRWNTLTKFNRQKRSEVIDVARSRVLDYLLHVVTQPRESLLGRPSFISLLPDDLRPMIVWQWRHYLQEQPVDDPVFGPWRRLLDSTADHWTLHADAVLAQLATIPVGTSQGQINPLVKHVLLRHQPRMKSDVGRIYGQLLTDVYSRWQAAQKRSHAGEPSLAERQLQQILIGPGSPITVPEETSRLRPYLTRSDLDQQAELIHELKKYEAHTPGAPPRAMSLMDKPEPYQARVFLRGDPTRLGPPVSRRFLRLLAGDDERVFTDGSGRLDLARAIADPGNPLTARVIVNRVWMWHLGRPLVATPSDFGVRSDPPSHPQLLDYLSTSLIQNGWSLKWLHREIMLSATYRQASRDREECRSVDPENRWLWRANRRRLEVEPMRDSLLAVAGRLDTTMGGRPVDMVGQPFSRRRMVYGIVDRQDLPRLYRDFDFANPDQSIAQRSRTTVPQQALFMLNSPFVIEQARHLATREQTASVDDVNERITQMYKFVFARLPMETELEISRRYLQAAQRHGSDRVKLHAWEQLAQILLLTNEFVYVD